MVEQDAHPPEDIERLKRVLEDLFKRLDVDRQLIQAVRTIEDVQRLARAVRGRVNETTDHLLEGK